MSKLCDECETVAHCMKHGCIPKQQALDKKAENARELGLDYEPPTYTFKQSSELPITLLEMKPNYNITYYRDGKQIGVLDFNGPEMTFTGDADESAKLFFDYIAKAFKGRMDQERADERARMAEQPAPVQQETVNGRTVKVDWKAQALELRELVRLGGIKIAELEAALAEQPAQQEPVGEVNRYGRDSHGRKWHGIHWYDPNVDVPHGTKLYTSPPAQQEPVAWIVEDQSGERLEWASDANSCHGVPTFPLYTSQPAQRTWVGLTDKERNSLWREIIGWGDPSHDDEDLMKAIEDASRRKNT